MAAGTTRLADLIVPQIFANYTQQLTQEKTRLIQSGAIVMDPTLDAALAGGGLTFNEPSFRDLDRDPDNVSSDDPAVFSAPNKIQASNEIQVGLSRNQSWTSMDLAADLIGPDPVEAISQRVSSYWASRAQAAFVATMQGVFADNAAAPTGADTHTINDMTFNVSGVSYTAGVTDFNAGSFIDATLTMGDSMEDLALVMVHSIVYARMLKNNLITFIAPAVNPDGIRVPTFLGREVVVDDGVPRSGGVFESWLFGRGAVRLGTASPKVPVEPFRAPSAGNGGGQDSLYNRVRWCIHPVGHAFIATPGNGGPSNAATATNLAHLDSWRRVYPTRKQIAIARLITREF